jgi:hypothetical protein
MPKLTRNRSRTREQNLANFSRHLISLPRSTVSARASRFFQGPLLRYDLRLLDQISYESPPPLHSSTWPTSL